MLKFVFVDTAHDVGAIPLPSAANAELQVIVGFLNAIAEHNIIRYSPVFPISVYFTIGHASLVGYYSRA